MERPTKDWLRVVFGSGLIGDDRAPGSDAHPERTEISVRHIPSRLDPAGSPGGEQRVRVTVTPSEPGLGWALYLRVLDSPSAVDPGRVWWRVEPGTWQPLVGSPQVVAAGRGRIRIDVDLRVVARDGGSQAPRLQFTALSRS